MNIELDAIREDITRMVKVALEEDIGTGDITAELIPEDKTDTASIITREDCILCGSAWLNEVFKQLGGLESITWHAQDGDFVSANSRLVTLNGNTRTLLTGERTALNFLQLLSGVATKASHYARAVAGSRIKILDTRKTIPGLRFAQKYAVATGGCYNHRIGLYDAFLIKENHIAAAGSITKAVNKARTLHPEKPLIVEVETEQELHEALACDVTRIMLDNFGFAALENLFADTPPTCPVEISGNIDLTQLNQQNPLFEVYVSSGDLTKNIQCIDLSMIITS